MTIVLEAFFLMKKKGQRGQPKLDLRLIRATTSVDAKSCKIQKALHFTHFDQKNTYISECKIVHKYTSTTVTVHIYTVTVTLAFNILVFFFLSPCLQLLSLSPHSSFFSFDQIIKTTKPLNLSPPLISHRSPLPLISRRLPRSLSDR